jgi:hypothetical protein
MKIFIFKTIKRISIIFFAVYFIFLLITPAGNCYNKYQSDPYASSIKFSPNRNFIVASCRIWGQDNLKSFEVHDIWSGRLLFQTTAEFGLSNRSEVNISNSDITIISDEEDSNGKLVTIQTTLPPPWYEQARAYIISIF